MNTTDGLKQVDTLEYYYKFELEKLIKEKERFQTLLDENRKEYNLVNDQLFKLKLVYLAKLVYSKSSLKSVIELKKEIHDLKHTSQLLLDKIEMIVYKINRLDYDIDIYTKLKGRAGYIRDKISFIEKKDKMFHQHTDLRLVKNVDSYLNEEKIKRIKK